MEDPAVVATVNYPVACLYVDVPGPPEPTECMKATNPGYPAWDAWGKPDCWCYSRQCRGDADGIKSGPFWVAIPDLNLFRQSFNKVDTILATVANGICCDADHLKSGPFRVAIPDLNNFRLYFNKPELIVTICDKSEIFEWCVPGQQCPPPAP
jgi:hypothetical protein